MTLLLASGANPLGHVLDQSSGFSEKFGTDVKLSVVSLIVGALIVLRGPVQLEEMRFDRLNGYFSVPALALVSGLVLWVASRFYGRKEACTDSGPLRMPTGWWMAMMAVAAAVAGIALLGLWFANNFSRLL